jgi:hypothetical protein
MSRTKSAIFIFIFIVAAIIIALRVDYTDKYVGDRFTKALESGQYDDNQSFSLDAFLEFYDWDKVCIVLPGTQMDFRTRGKLPYKLKWNDEDHWTLVLTKAHYVMVEIPFHRNKLEAPDHLDGMCFERWKAIVKIVDQGGTPKLRFVGE